MNKTFERLKTFAEGHGVKFVKVTDDEMFDRSDIEKAPFSSDVGINWHKKILFYTKEDAWPDMVHELGHVLACKIEPKASKEFTFFGWEYAVVKRIKGSRETWVKSNKDYAVSDNGTCVGDLTLKQLNVILRERMSAAKKSRLVTACGVPQAVR